MRLHLLYANITEARTTTLQILKLLYAGVCHGEIDVPFALTPGCCGLRGLRGGTLNFNGAVKGSTGI